MDGVFEGESGLLLKDKETLKRELYGYLFQTLDRCVEIICACSVAPAHGPPLLRAGPSSSYTRCASMSLILSASKRRATHCGLACLSLQGCVPLQLCPALTREPKLSTLTPPAPPPPQLRARIGVILGHDRVAVPASADKRGIAWEVRRVSHFHSPSTGQSHRAHGKTAAQAAIKTMLERLEGLRERGELEEDETAEGAPEGGAESEEGGMHTPPPRSRSPSPSPEARPAAAFARGGGVALSPGGFVGWEASAASPARVKAAVQTLASPPRPSAAAASSGAQQAHPPTPSYDSQPPATAVMLLNQFERLNSGQKWGDFMLLEEEETQRPVAPPPSTSGGGPRAWGARAPSSDTSRSGETGFPATGAGGREVPAPESPLKGVSSPGRPRGTPDEIIARTAVRQAKAEANRDRIVEERKSRFAEAAVRQAEVAGRVAAAKADMTTAIATKLSAAEERHEGVLRAKSAKAGIEVAKAAEVRFMGRLDAEAKRAALAEGQAQAAKRRAETLAKRTETVPKRVAGEKPFSYAVATSGKPAAEAARAQPAEARAAAPASAVAEAVAAAVAVAFGPLSEAPPATAAAAIEASAPVDSHSTKPPVKAPVKAEVKLAPWAGAKKKAPVALAPPAIKEPAPVPAAVPQHVKAEALVPSMGIKAAPGPSATAAAQAQPILAAPAASAWKQPRKAAVLAAALVPEEPLAQVLLDAVRVLSASAMAGKGVPAAPPAPPAAAEAPTTATAEWVESAADALAPPMRPRAAGGAKDKVAGDRGRPARKPAALGRGGASSAVAPVSADVDGWVVVGMAAPEKTTKAARGRPVAAQAAPVPVAAAPAAPDVRVVAPLRDAGANGATSPKVPQEGSKAAGVMDATAAPLPVPAPARKAVASAPRKPAALKAPASNDEALLNAILKEQGVADSAASKGDATQADGGALVGTGSVLTAARRKRIRQRRLAVAVCAAAYAAAVAASSAGGEEEGSNSAPADIAAACISLCKEVPADDAQSPAMPLSALGAGAEAALKSVWDALGEGLQVTEALLIISAQKQQVRGRAADGAVALSDIPDHCVLELLRMDQHAVAHVALAARAGAGAGVAAEPSAPAAAAPTSGPAAPVVVTMDRTDVVIRFGAADAAYRCLGPEAAAATPRAAALAARIAALLAGVPAGCRHALSRGGAAILVDALVAGCAALVAALGARWKTGRPVVAAFPLFAAANTDDSPHVCVVMNTAMALSFLLRHEEAGSTAAPLVAAVGAAVSYALAAGLPSALTDVLRAITVLGRTGAVVHAPVAAVALATLVAMLRRPLVDERRAGEAPVYAILAGERGDGAAGAFSGCTYLASLLSFPGECGLLEAVGGLVQTATGSGRALADDKAVHQVTVAGVQAFNALVHLDLRVAQRLLSVRSEGGPACSAAASGLLAVLDECVLKARAALAVAGGAGSGRARKVDAESALVDAALGYGYAGLVCPAFADACAVRRNGQTLTPLSHLARAPSWYLDDASLRAVLLPALLVLVDGSPARRDLLLQDVAPAALLACITDARAAGAAAVSTRGLGLASRVPASRWAGLVLLLEPKGALAGMD